jgi:hypothetical protein
MYGMVLMAAMTGATSDFSDIGHRNRGGCHGSGMVAGGCTGAHAGAGCTGAYAGSGCHGSKHHNRGNSCHGGGGGLFHRGGKGCHGGSGCHGGGMVAGGCTGVIVTPAQPQPMPKVEPKPVPPPVVAVPPAATGGCTGMIAAPCDCAPAKHGRLHRGGRGCHG